MRQVVHLSGSGYMGNSLCFSLLNFVELKITFKVKSTLVKIINIGK